MKASWLLVGLALAPSLGAVLLTALGPHRERLVRGVALASASLTAAFAWGLVRAVALAPGSVLELRAPLAGGVVFALGVDATGVAGLAIVALASPIVVALERPERRATVLGLVAAVLLASSSQDGIVTLLALVASVALVVDHARRSGVERTVRTRFAIVSGLGIVAFGIGLALLRSGAGDAVRSAPWLAPELARVPWLALGAKAHGMPVVTTAWSLLFVAAAVLGGLAPFHLAASVLLDDRRPALAASMGVVFFRLGPALLLRWALPILPEGTRWAAPVVLDWAIVAAVVTALAAHGRRPLGAAVLFANAGVFAAFATLDAQGLAALMLHGAASAAALALVLTLGVRGRLASFLVASGAGVGGVLVLAGVAARSPALALVWAVAMVVLASAPDEPATAPARPNRVATAVGVALLVALAAGAVDRIAPGVRALGERIERAGGDGAGS